MTRTTRPALRRLLLALGACAAGAALADEPNPYYLGVSQAFSYDSNVFRLPDAFAEGSWWSSTSLIGGFDQRYGRQRFYANGNVAANLYGQLGELDNTSYGLTAGWDWETAYRLSGKLYASFAQNLGNYGGFYDPLIRTKNVQNSTLAYATVQYGLASLLQADGRIAYSSTRYSAPQYARYELDQASINAALRRQFSGQLTLGTGVAYTRGDYFALNREFDRYDVFLSGYWTATGQSTVSGRVGYSWWTYTGINPYDQSGATGWVKWHYVPTGKLSFDTLLSYDTMANSGLTDVGGGTPGGLGDTNRLTAGVQLSATYALSGKTSLNASLQYFSRTEDFLINPPPGFPPTPIETRDRITSLSLGATWNPTRNWQVNCNIYSKSRNQYSDQPIALTPYDALGGSCALQFVLQ